MTICLIKGRISRSKRPLPSVFLIDCTPSICIPFRWPPVLFADCNHTYSGLIGNCFINQGERTASNEVYFGRQTTGHEAKWRSVRYIKNFTLHVYFKFLDIECIAHALRNFKF